MRGIFKTLLDKLVKTELPYRRMFLVIDLNIYSDGDTLYSKLKNKNKDSELHNKQILQQIKVPAVNNAVYMLAKGDFIIIDDEKILDELKFIDYIEFNADYFADNKNSFRILCKNYIAEHDKIIFIVDCLMAYNNNMNIVLKLVKPDKLDDKGYLQELVETQSKLVSYDYSNN